MKILNKVFLFTLFLFSESCATQGNFVTENKDFWYKDSDKGLFYCKANVLTNSLADPSCFEAGFQVYTVSDKKNKN